jgi:hypothetical protein
MNFGPTKTVGEIKRFISLTVLVYFANGPDFLTSGDGLGMSIHNEDHVLAERELHHAQKNHEGPAIDCETCERFDLAAYSGYVNGLDEWYEKIGQFMAGVEVGIGATR